MSFWRKLNKLVFYISLVTACIAVIAGSIWGFCQKSIEFHVSSNEVVILNSSWIGTTILFGGTILILVLFSAWGIFLEFLDNVADIRRAVCKGQHIPSSQTSQIEQVSNTTSSVPQTEQFSAEQVVVPKGWTCTGCGKYNDADAVFCYNCGKPKE